MKHKLSLSLLCGLFFAGAGVALASCGINSDPEEPSVSSVVTSVEPTSSSQQSEEEPTSSSTTSVEPTHVHEWQRPTWTWTPKGDDFTAQATFVCKGDSSHKQVVNAEVAKRKSTEVTCTTAGEALYTATVTFDGNTYIDTKSKYIAPTGHQFGEDYEIDKMNHWHECEICHEKKDNESHLLETRLISETGSTCTEAGSKVEETYCSICGQIVSTNTTSYKLKNHTYDVVIEYVAPTCTTSGYRVYKCHDCDSTLTENLNALGHLWNHEPTCTEKASCTREGCNAEKAALGHNYEKVDSTTKTCTQDGIETYHCTNCDHEYVIRDKASGHVYSGTWTFDHEERVSGKDCTYKYYYKNHCSECDEDVYQAGDEEVVKHTFIARIQKDATCKETGLKQYICKDCGYVDESKNVVLPVNDNHNWQEYSVSGGITTYHCLDCEAVKTSINAVNSVDANVTTAALTASTEITLQEATIEMDEATKNALAEIGNDVNLSVETADVNDLNLSEEDLARLGDSPVYNFSITQEGNDSASEFQGEVTIKIPYELKEGEDADSLTVFYIDDDGVLHDQNAVYENGNAVFTVKHFSFYSVSFLTPEEKCRKLNEHIFGDPIVVEKTCITDGYQYQVCERCGYVAIDPESVDPATGHHYVANSEGHLEPDCTHAGHTDYVCEYCGEGYGQDLPALGHDIELVSYKPSSCVEEGTYTYACKREGCDETYTEKVPATGHHYVPEVHPATCSEAGYIDYVCDHCDANTPGHVDTARRQELPKLEHSFVLDEEQPGDGYDHYHCEYGCGETKLVSRNEKIDHGYVVNNSYLSNIGKTVLKDELTFTTEHSLLSFEMNGREMVFDVKNGEAHIGLDDNNNILAYGKAYIDFDGANMEGEVAFYIKDNIFYYKFNAAGSQKTDYQMIDLSEISLGSTVKLGDILDRLPDIIKYLKEDVKPYIDGLIEENSEDVNDTLYKLFDKFMKYRSTADGFVVEVDFDKVQVFFNKVKNDSIEEAYDYIFGTGSLDRLINRLADYADKSFYALLKSFKDDYGFDYEEFLALVDKGVRVCSGEEYNSLRDYILQMTNGRFDLNDYLREAYLRNNSIVSVIKDAAPITSIFADKTIAEYLRTNVKDYVDRNLFDILVEDAKVKRSSINEVNEYIDKYIAALKVASHLSVTTDKKGSFQAAQVKIDLDEDIRLLVDLDIVSGSNYVSTYDYASMINLCNSVNSIIYREKFSTDEKIRDFFGENVTYVTDEAGNIIRVSTNEANNYDYDYGYEYGGSQQRNQPIAVTSEEVLFSYTNQSYYNRLVDMYENNKETSNMVIKTYDYGYTYDYTHFGASRLSFSEECQNTYDVSFAISSDVTREYNGVEVTLVNKETLEETKYSFYNSSYRYGSSSNFRATVNTVSGKEVTTSGGHDWKLLENESNLNPGCGKEGYKTYICMNCGKKKTENFLVPHGEPRLVSADLKDGVNFCTNGMVLHYHCDECGEDYDIESYDYDGENNINGHYLDTTANHKVINGKDFYFPTCLCHEYNGQAVIDGYGFKGNSAYFGSDEMMHYLALYNSNTDPEDWIALETSVIHPNEDNECFVQEVVNAYFGFEFNEEENRFSYTKKETIQVDEGHYSHDFTSYILYSTIEYDEDNDLYYGYRECERCGERVKSNIDRYSYPEFIITNKELGLPLDDEAYITLYANLYDEGKGKYIGEIRIDRVINSKNYSFNHQWHDNPDGTYVEEFHCVTDGVNFNIKVIHSYQYKVDNCRTNRCNMYYIGYKNSVDDAKFTIKTDDYYYGEQHTFNSEPTSYEARDFNARVLVYDDNCAVCGVHSSYTTLEAIDSSRLYKQSKEVQNGSITTYYPAGYDPVTGIVFGSGGGIHIYNEQTREQKNIDRYLYASNYYYEGENLPGFYYGEEIDSYSDLEHYSVHSSSYKHSSYVIKNGSVVKISENSDVHERLYPFYESERFAAAFKDITGYTYDLNKYGCDYFIEYSKSTDSNGNEWENYRLEKTGNHVSYKGTSPTCTQPGVGHCDYCGKTIIQSPYGHSFDYQEDGYECWRCGTHSDSRYNNDELWLEDMNHDKHEEAHENVLRVGYYDSNRPNEYGLALADLDYDLAVTLYTNDKGELPVALSNIRQVEGEYVSAIELDKDVIRNMISQYNVEEPTAIGFTFINKVDNNHTYSLYFDMGEIDPNYARITFYSQRYAIDISVDEDYYGEEGYEDYTALIDFYQRVISRHDEYLTMEITDYDYSYFSYRVDSWSDDEDGYGYVYDRMAGTPDEYGLNLYRLYDYREYDRNESDFRYSFSPLELLEDSRVKVIYDNETNDVYFVRNFEYQGIPVQIAYVS